MPGAVLVVVCHHHFQSYLLSQLEYILHFFILGFFQSSGDERAGIRVDPTLRSETASRCFNLK